MQNAPIAGWWLGLPRRALVLLFVTAGCLLGGNASADGRLLATGGLTDIEGSAGGGLVPWALIAGYGTRDQATATAFFTDLELDAFRLRSTGLALGLYDRLELSYARQRFDLESSAPGSVIQQDIVGAKLKLLGDAVFAPDSAIPQVALGAELKHGLDFNVPRAVGARDDGGTDLYLAATKLYFAAVFGHNLLLDATVIATRGNQFGLLGFGGDLNQRYRALPAGSAAVFLSDQVAVGAEYRDQPNNLSASGENPSLDVFAAYIPNKHLALTAAYVRLGQIAKRRRNDGLYMSLQLSQ